MSRGLGDVYKRQGIQELMKIIDKEHKGLEQEIFNSKEYKKYTD